MTEADGGLTAPPSPAGKPEPVVLSVIVPVYDQERVIADNVRIVCEKVAESLEGEFEVIVVSDGSLDGTVERILESGIPRTRLIHYDRNLGKGYAIKTGAREARGRWVGYVDADLDLDPAALPEFVAVGEREGLDFVIGSKRHPDSQVHYPRSRVAASWLFQQLVHLLFALEVRDTQVGLKVFRREVVDEVLPLLLVKRFAFDVELLAVARAFGRGRIKEMPVVLDYQFTGSGVRSVAVAFALLDTFAVFYRLRILRYYQRRRAHAGATGWAVPSDFSSAVTMIEQADTARRRELAQQSEADLLAFLDPGARPSANWVTATVPFFAWPDLDVVVTPQLAPAGGSVRERGAASVAESRVGGGSLHFRFTPGSIRFVPDFPARCFVVRRERFLSLPAETAPEAVVRELSVAEGSALYFPEASVVLPPAPLFRPHLRRIASYGRNRGELIRSRGFAASRPSTLAAIALMIWACFGWILLLAGGVAVDVWLVVWCLYLGTIAVAAALGGLRFYSGRVALATGAGLLLTHLVYIVTFIQGFSRPRSAARPTRIST